MADTQVFAVIAGKLDERRNTMNELTYTVKGACKLTNVGQTTIYQALNDGTLIGKKVGRRTLITHDALRRWIDNLPMYTPQVGQNHGILNT